MLPLAANVEQEKDPVRPNVTVLRAESMPRVFVLYEHRLLSDILTNLLGDNVVGSTERATASLTAIVEMINCAHPNVVIIESQANGNTAWHILLAGAEARRVMLLDMERGTVREHAVRTTAIDTLDELLEVIREK